MEEPSAVHGMLSLLADSEVVVVADVSIRNLNDQVKEKLRIRAAGHGRSMEAEIRAILEDAVRDPRQSENLLQTVLGRFGDLGGLELELPARSTPPRAADPFR